MTDQPATTEALLHALGEPMTNSDRAALVVLLLDRGAL